MRLLIKLKKYTKKNIVAMHMPGHKRHGFAFSKIPYKLDITEIDGFDNLHNPEGILKHCQDKATKLYKTKQSFYLVNGSTCGILASIKSCCGYGDKIIMPKNCHKSVYHALELLNLNCVFIPTQTDENGIIKEVSLSQLTQLLEKNQDAKCVLITSPTYEGVISDIKLISKVVHKYNIPLIVDEAHGAHLFLQDKSAVNFGADLVVNSLHKTLPSLTQTALLHVCSNRVDIKTIRHNLAVFMSSSPSYILMSSIDECIEFLNKKGIKCFKRLTNNLDFFANQCKNLKHLKILSNQNSFFDLDNTKIVILTNKTNISGNQLSSLLRKHKIELEMAYTNYALAYATVFDRKKSFVKLYKALKKIDKNLTEATDNMALQNFQPELKLNITNALSLNNQMIKFKNCIGKICGEYVWIYPPGIPILVPGEVITKQVYDYIFHALQTGLDVKSSKSLLPDKINVLKT